jgi:hypothetical protein
VSTVQRPVLIQVNDVRVVRRRVARLCFGLVVAGCAATGGTLRSNHFRLAVPPSWQVIEAGGGEDQLTVVRAPATGGAAAVEVHLRAWLVHRAPPDPAGDVLARLAATNVLGLATAHADDNLCADRAAQFFVFGTPARAIRLTDSDGRRVVVTAGESGGSLVAVIATIAAGDAGCAGVKAMDAALEQVAASMTGAGDISRPVPPATFIDDPRSSSTRQIPNADPSAPR